LKAGIKVEANFRGRGRYFAGTIAKVNSDGTFDIDYDNRQSEYRVHAIDIRSMERGIEKIDDDSDDDYDFDFDHDYQRGKSGRK
jgi:multisubunit Na+/H+ antiporter MnhE subunit